MKKNNSDEKYRKEFEQMLKEKEALIKLIDKSANKKGKFKKDFCESTDKILNKLNLIPDKNGKIQFTEGKRESPGDYNPTLKSHKMKEFDPKKEKNGMITFPQNTMKKPKTKGQQIKKENLMLKGQYPGLQQKKGHISSMAKPYESKKAFGSKGLALKEAADQKKNDKFKFKGYEEFMELSEVEKLLASGELYQGVFIRNERNPRANFIKCPQIEQKILFKQYEHENRAMHNSVVVFKITSGRPKLVKKDEPHIILEDEEDKNQDSDQPEFELNPGETANELEDEDEEEKSEDEDDEDDDEQEIDALLDKGQDIDIDDIDIEEQKKILKEIKNTMKEGDKMIDDEVSDDVEESEEEKVDLAKQSIDVDKNTLQAFGFELKEEKDKDEEEEDEEDSEEESDDEKEKNFHTRYHPPIRQSGPKNKPNEKKDDKKNDNKKRNNSNSHTSSPSSDALEGRIEGKKVFAKIVYIIDNPQMQRKFVVKLRRNPPWHEALFRAEPIEGQLPMFDLVTFAPEVPAKSDSLEAYYLAEYLYWPINNKYPYGQIVDEIGNSGAVDIESEALLRNYDVYTKDFGPETYEYLGKYEKRCDPVSMEYKISEEEIKDREDLRDFVVFTCDPKTARDLDDALSVKEVEPGVYEIGVHIADVSHFVKEKTPLDEEARLRTTTVYLVHKAIPMLPHLLCQNLCSLNPGLERLTFSCFFYVNEEGVVLYDRAPRITKSIIKTCIRFDYDMLQEVFDGKITDEKDLPVLFYPTGVKPGDIIKSCHLMNNLAQNIRKNRFETGSMSFERNKYRFELDETNYPKSIFVDKRKESSFMVEEYMLLANKFVGKFIVDTCTEIGVLRCHPPPSNKRLDFIQNILGKMNLKIDFGNSKSIQDSLAKIIEDPKVPQSHKTIVKARLCRLMEAAKYFVVEDLGPEHWRHFALNFDVYTHFTSPIRRYPDILVHRLAEKCLQYKENVKEHVNKYLMLSIMDKCNNCKLNSKRVSDASEKIFLSLYLRNNPTHTEAIVLFCGPDALEVYIPMIEQEIKIETKKIKNLVKAIKGVSNNVNTLDLEYQVDKKSPSIIIKLKEYNSVPVYVTGTNEFPIDVSVKLVYEAKDKKIILE